MVYNKKIVFLKKTVSKDEIGQETPEWKAEGRPVYARVTCATGKLYYEAARAKEENTLLFQMPYRSLPKDFNRLDYRLLYEGETYEIKQCVPAGARQIDAQLRGVSII